jgi:hypothetical protein
VGKSSRAVPSSSGACVRQAEFHAMPSVAVREALAVEEVAKM